MSSDQSQQTPVQRRPVRAVVMTITLLATLVSLLGILGMLGQYFAHAAVWPSLMAIGLWGLPFAFVGLAWLICISVRDRRAAEREAVKVLNA